MKSVVLVVVLIPSVLGACATTPTRRDHDPPLTAAQLARVPSEDVPRIVPSAIEPRLPSVDLLANEVRTEIGERITAQLAI